LLRGSIAFILRLDERGLPLKKTFLAFVVLLALTALTACSKRKETGSAASTSTSGPTSAEADAAFWKWFILHKDEVGKVARADEPIANELATHLHKIDKDLTFELAVATKDHELIISAGGIQSTFPAVRRLVAVARRSRDGR